MKAALAVLFAIALCCLGAQSLAAQSSARFERYPVKVYRGRIHRPAWIRHVANDEWRDELDKVVEAPTINFAGKYFVASHGCGNYCRYYTMTDLSSGLEINVLKIFGTGKEMRDGYGYLAELITRRNSRMRVVQWRFEASRDECRERVFVLHGTRLKPIMRTRSRCTQY